MGGLLSVNTPNTTTNTTTNTTNTTPNTTSIAVSVGTKKYTTPLLSLGSSGSSSGPTISNSVAIYIKNKQENVLQSLQDLNTKLNTLSINAQENFSDNNIAEGFTGETETVDPIQSPVRLPYYITPELDEYVNFYNKSVALLDDPNRLSQANFDAYIHMQDMKINDLKATISSFPTNPSLRDNQIKSIKNLKTSSVLNVEPYPDPTKQTSLPTSYVGNGAVNYPNYVIYGNNGCMQYSPSSSNSQTAASWSFKPCNSNLPGQRFNMKQINNMDDYNARITNPDNLSYKINDPNSSVFGFYVVNPEGYSDQCLQLNHDGLSVMPCNMESSQRFKPNYHNVLP
jgi:hypothetical protein